MSVQECDCEEEQYSSSRGDRTRGGKWKTMTIGRKESK